MGVRTQQSVSMLYCQQKYFTHFKVCMESVRLLVERLLKLRLA